MITALLRPTLDYFRWKSSFPKKIKYVTWDMLSIYWQWKELNSVTYESLRKTLKSRENFGTIVIQPW